MTLISRFALACVVALFMMFAGPGAAVAAPPSVTVVEPDPGDVVSGTHTLDVKTSSTTKRVNYYIDGEFHAYDSSCCTWDEEWDSRTVPDGDHTITAKAYNSAGEVGTSAPVAFKVDNYADPIPSTPVYGIFASSAADYATIRHQGFNTVTVSSLTQLDRAHANGLGGVYWLGGYDNEPTCRYQTDDAWVTSQVNAVKNHPALRGYQIENEPHATECPNAPADVRHRAQLVRSLDPNMDHPTLLAVYRDYEFDDYANATDALRVGMYPCSDPNRTDTVVPPCNFNRITEKVAAARAAGWTRLWGSPQANGDEYYRMPTPAEEQTILDTWRAAGVNNLLAFAWDRYDDDTLSVHPELWPVFQASAP